MTTINNFSIKEFDLGSKLALENAKSHFKIAKISSNENQYGIATGLLILSIEELAKATILKIKSKHKHISVKNIEKCFYNHGFKHAIFINITSQIILKNEKEKNEVDQNYNDLSIILIISISILIYIIWHSFSEKKLTRKKSVLDVVKESGFYFGYSDRGSWEIPNKIYTHESTKVLIDMVQRAFNIIENFIFNEDISSHEIISFVEQLDDDIINKKELQKILINKT